MHTSEDHLDPTTEITLENIKERAVKGVAVLTGRTMFLSVISLIAIGFLTVFLEPSEFGIFWAVSAVVNFLAYFSDVGLAAALIQKKGKVDDQDLLTTFTVQQGIVLTLLLILYVATPYIQSNYDLSNEGRLLVFALGLSLFMSSLKTIPSVLLERELDFSRLVIPQVFENLAYNITAVFFAWQGYGVTAFTYAVLARGVVGLVGIYALKPWMPGIAFNKKSLKELLKFGVPYQANTLLATVKDDGMTAYLGAILGTAGLGYLGWAQKWAQYPLRLFMDHVLKVTFPAFSRMQEETEHLRRSLTRSIFFVCFLVFPSVVGMYLLAPLMIEIVPRYEKWRPALIPLGFISINVLISAATTQLTNLFNSIGKIKLTFKLMLMWTALTWLLIPYLSRQYGVNGAAAGYALVSTSSVVALYLGKKIMDFSILDSIVKPLSATAVMGIAIYLARDLFSPSILWIGALVTVGSIIYMIVVYLFVGKWIISDAKRGLKAVYQR